MMIFYKFLQKCLIFYNFMRFLNKIIKELFNFISNFC